MRVADPCGWVIDRLECRVPFFSVRFNDGEMQMMYRAVPEGKVLGTDANPCRADYGLGTALRNVLLKIGVAGPKNCEDVLIGSSWGTDRADELSGAGGPFDEDCRQMALWDFNLADEHWPLDGVVTGGTVRMLDYLRTERETVLVTSTKLSSAKKCCADWYIQVPPADSWNYRNTMYEKAKVFAETGCVFIWAAGCGLKPTAWRLWREFPQSSHVDVGHLFNGACGLRDYGWLQRGDGPWHEPYFRPGGFADWVRSFVK